MGARTITVVHNADRSRLVRVSYNSEYREFTCRMYIDMVRYSPADYYTNDKADAIATANSLVNHNPSHIEV